MTAIVDDYMLSELRTSVAKTGAKFLVCRNGKPMYIDSIKELQDYLKANDLYIYEFELWNNIIHYVCVRGERGGDYYMNIFTNKKEMKKWAIAMANACGGQEVTQTSLKLNHHRPDKVQKLSIKFVEDYNEQMLEAIKLAQGEITLDEVGKEEE